MPPPVEKDARQHRPPGTTSWPRASRAGFAPVQVNVDFYLLHAVRIVVRFL